MEIQSEQNKQNWLDTSALANIKISWEMIIFGIILILAVISRFYDLGTRVISHDETSHVYYAWRLFKGMGYSHDPITHGPFQFHFLALIYFLFGDSDYTARIPAAITSVVTILFLWKYRRYLGNWGTLAAAVMFLISPYMLYYGRYVRNEAFSALFGIVTIWAILRYFETQSPRYLYWLTAATVLHFTSKETAFIYTAQALIFLGIVYIFNLLKFSWLRPVYKNIFIGALLIALLIIGIAGITQVFAPESPEIPETTQPAPISLMIIVPLILVALLLLIALYCSIRGYGWDRLISLPSFSMMLLLLTLVLPQLAPFPAKVIGLNSLDYSTPGMLKTGAIIFVLVAVSVTIGILWNPKEWLINAAIFYIPFTILYTTVFTNGKGFFTGLVGSLAYWLNQQAVERGSQPWYYYWLIQIPVYEYLPALGATITAIGGVIHRILNLNPNDKQVSDNNQSNDVPVFFLLSFWSLTSLLIYPVAGEKMPWLTVHISFPLILLSAWGFQKLIVNFKWKSFSKKNGWVVILLTLLLLASIGRTFGSLLSTNPPFQGMELYHLDATGNFLSALLITIVSGFLLFLVIRTWEPLQVLITTVLSVVLILVLLTTHTAVQAAFINYDNPTEYLVYAHGGRGIKEALAQIEELSYRTSDGLAMDVAFDNETTYPFWWYLRNYENQRYYAENPTRDLRNYPVILVGNNNYSKLEPVVGNSYHEFTYNRIVWPNQDYYDLTWERIWNAISNPDIREGLFRIWLLRDYQKYAEATNKTISLSTWSPADQMKLFVRKDVAARVWNYGSPQDEYNIIVADPYEGKERILPADINLDQLNLLTPRNVEYATDGTLFILDTGNHRVLHVSPDGEILMSWGEFGSLDPGTDAAGIFNEPWGIALGPDGNLYIADTWNHRIQKFSPEGNYLTSWGRFGQREAPDAFWGPRDVVVDEQGHVYVADTGNKRIVVFNGDGEFLVEFGDVGLGDGQFDEPSGLALDADGNLYVADTWNQRIQVFSPDVNGIAQYFFTKWDVDGWYGQSLDNKPYLTIGSDGNVYISDPELSRIIVFSPIGEVLHTWGVTGDDLSSMDLPTGLSADSEGGIWVSDTQNNRILHFPPITP